MGKQAVLHLIKKLRSIGAFAASSEFIFTVALGLLVISMAGCERYPEGIDFEKGLVRKDDGLVYRIGEHKPYTGKAYDSVCATCEPFIHWRGEFKDGQKHGTFVFPTSRDSNASFRPGDLHVVRVKFANGVEVGKAD